MDKLSEAIQMLGGVTATARLLGVTQGCVSNWRIRGTPVPAELCLLIEMHTGKRVTCEEMRPDVKWHVLRNSARPVGAGAEACAEIRVIAAPDAANDAGQSPQERA